MLSHDETGREAERRRQLAEPYRQDYLRLREERDAALRLLDALEQGTPAWREQGRRALRLAEQARRAHRDYDEALAYGRALTRRERREIIRRGG